MKEVNSSDKTTLNETEFKSILLQVQFDKKRKTH